MESSTKVSTSTMDPTLNICHGVKVNYSNCCNEWCRKNRMESHHLHVPCTAREFKQMYGTDSLVDLFSRVATSLANFQTKTNPNETEIKQFEIDQIVMKVMKVIAEPSSSALGIEFSSHIEHALHKLGQTFIGFGSNDTSALGFENNSWTDFKSGKEISTFIKDASKSQPQSFITEDFEENETGSVDLGHKIYSTVGIDSNIDFLALGCDFTYFVYACGCIGLAGTWSESFARLFKYPWSRELSAVHPSMFCSCLVSKDKKTLLAFGYNSMGQSSSKLGDAFLFPKPIDPKLYNYETIRFVSVGLETVYVVTEQNNLYVSGGNQNHELGIEWIRKSKINDSNRIVFDYEVSEEVLEKVQERKMIPALTMITNLPKDEKIIQVSTGEKHTIILTDAGNMYCSGSNHVGQLGIGTISCLERFEKHPFSNIEKVKHVHCFQSCTVWITENDTVYVCGENSNSELGLVSNEENQNFLEPIFHPILSGKGIIKICGVYNLFAISKNGEYYCWGSNEENELGLDEYSLSSYNPGTIERNYSFERYSNLVKTRGYRAELLAGFNHTVIFFKVDNKRIVFMFQQLQNFVENSASSNSSLFSDISIVHEGFHAENVLKRKYDNHSSNIDSKKQKIIN